MRELGLRSSALRRQVKLIKAVLWFTLFKVAALGAYDKAVQVSTTQLAKTLGVSQQTASRHLIELEKEDLLERHMTRGGELVKLTAKGRGEIRSVHLQLSRITEPKAYEGLLFEGELFTGVGEGAYYMSLEGYRRQFRDKLGFNPYPGTLNIRLLDRNSVRRKGELRYIDGIVIDGFKDENRTYGPVKCFKALINDQVEAAVALMDRSHYDDSVMELISPSNMREMLGLKDGDVVKVRALIAGSSTSSP